MKQITLLPLALIVLTNMAFAQRTENINIIIQNGESPAVVGYAFDSCSGREYVTDLGVLGRVPMEDDQYSAYTFGIDGKYKGDKRERCYITNPDNDRIDTYFNLNSLTIRLNGWASCTIKDFGLTYAKNSFYNYHYDALVSNTRSEVDCPEKNGYRYKIVQGGYNGEYYSPGYIMISK